MSTFADFALRLRLAMPDAQTAFHEHIDVTLARVCEQLDERLPYPPWNRTVVRLDTWTPDPYYENVVRAALPTDFREIESVRGADAWSTWFRLPRTDLVRPALRPWRYAADARFVYVTDPSVVLTIEGWSRWKRPTRTDWTDTIIEHDADLAMMGVRAVYDRDNPSDRTQVSDATWRDAIDARHAKWLIERSRGLA